MTALKIEDKGSAKENLEAANVAFVTALKHEASGKKGRYIDAYLDKACGYERLAYPAT